MTTPIHLHSFEDIASLDDDQIKEIIERVGRDDLTVALKAATEPVKDRVLANLSAEQRLSLIEYMEAVGPMRLFEVEFRQLQIVYKFKEASQDAFV